MSKKESKNVLIERKKIRLDYWDYRSSGAYFITICTSRMLPFFGEIKNEIMALNKLGCLVAKSWQAIPKHFADVELDEWIIMPNHIHGIIWIGKNRMNVRTRHGASLRNEGFRPNKFGPLLSNSVSSIINQFKGAVKKEANKNNIPFAWKSLFYDHIVRNESDLERIREYIRNNPKACELNALNYID